MTCRGGARAGQGQGRSRAGWGGEGVRRGGVGWREEDWRILSVCIA